MCYNRIMKKSKNFLIIVLICSLFSLIGFLCACNSNDNPIFYNVVYTANEGGYISGESAQVIERDGDARSVVAIAYEGYEFLEWSDGVITSERQDKNINADKSFEAKFKKKVPDYKYFTVSYLANQGGHIEGKNNQIVKENENAERVIAVPNVGYEFLEWSDGVTTSERQDKDIVEDKSITAIFEKIRFTVTYNVGVGGTIDGITTQEIEYGEDANFVVAVPNNGYKFLKWSDGNGSTIRREENVTSAINVTAEFEFLYEGGDGSSENPFTISSYSHLKNIFYYPEASYKLVNDLDLSGVVHEPIFSDGYYFQGNFNGNGHIIKCLTIETDSNYPSLFGVVGGGIIGNLNFTNANIIITDFNTVMNDQNCVGVVAGKASGFIYNIKVNGEINIDGLSYDSAAIGGLVGLANGTIADCSLDIQINIKNILKENTSNTYVPFAFGGLIGVSDSAHIRNCDVSGQINVTECFWNEEVSSVEISKCTDIIVGGMIGYYFTNRQVDSTIRDCKTDVYIYGDNHYEAGGNIGRLEVVEGTSLKIVNSSVHGDIEIGTVGGFICCGFSDGILRIENCYVENQITSYSRATGILERFTGNNNCSLSNCYSDSQLITHKLGEPNKSTGEAYGFSYQVSGISFLNCYSIFDISTESGGGFAFALNDCILEKCYLEGRFDVFTTQFNGLFAKSLSSTQVRNCYIQSNVNELQDKKNIFVFANMKDSSVTNFYYVGSDVENIVYQIRNSQINNFHLLRSSIQEFDYVSRDIGNPPSVLDVSIYYNAEDMFLLAEKLNVGLDEEIWINTLNNFPKLKTETNILSE